MMKKMFRNVLVVISLLLVVYAVLNIGVFLFHTLIDLLGYAIYLGVFAAPAIYLYHKRSVQAEETQN